MLEFLAGVNFPGLEALRTKLTIELMLEIIIL